MLEFFNEIRTYFKLAYDELQASLFLTIINYPAPHAVPTSYFKPSPSSTLT